MNLRHELAQITDLCGPEGMTLEALLKNSGSRSLAMGTLVLAIPFVLPVPLPGLSTPFGIIIAFIGIAIAFNAQPYLPKKLKKLVIPKKVLHGAIEKFNALLDRLGWLIGPRVQRLVSGGKARRLHGVLIFLSSLLLALPAPPGGNVGPALAVILFSIAILEEDGVLTLTGILTLLISTAVMAGIWVAIWESGKKLLS